MKLQDKKVIVVASSAVAAKILIDAETAQYSFKILVYRTIISTWNVPGEAKLTSTLLKVNVIIWDEIMVMHKHCIDIKKVLQRHKQASEALKWNKMYRTEYDTTSFQHSRTDLNG